VGGPYDNGFAGGAPGAGAAWVYTRLDRVWSQQAKLVGTGAIGPAVRQGWSVSLSGDGNTAIVGGDLDDNNAGAAWVYARPVFAGTPGKAKLFRQECLDARRAVWRAQWRCRSAGVP